VDLHAHEHIGAGRSGRELRYLAFIVEREALAAAKPRASCTGLA
jgi:hypothetical protein